MGESNKAYIEAVKCWLRKQDNDKKRNIQDIAMTKEQMILDDEVTRLAIIDFNAWAKENGEEAIEEVPKHKGYAIGTHPYLGGGLHWMGDREPELINFKGGESIVSIKDMKKLADRVSSIEHVIDGKTISKGNAVDKSIDDIAELVKKLFNIDMSKVMTVDVDEQLRAFKDIHGVRIPSSKDIYGH